MSAIRSIEGAVVQVITEFTQDGKIYMGFGSGFLVGPNTVVTAFHVAYTLGLVPTSISIIINGHSVPVSMDSIQSYVSLAEWNQRIKDNGYGMQTEGGVDIAVLRTTEAIGFQTGWFPLYDLDNGPVTVYGYPGGKYTVFSGGILQDLQNNKNVSWIPGLGAIPGESGGLVMDTAGNAVGVAVMGTEKEVVAVDLSPPMIAKVQDFIAVNNASIKDELVGREYYGFAHRLAKDWAEFNLSALAAQLDGPNTATASAQIKSTVESAITTLLPQFGAGNFVDAIFQVYTGAPPSKADHAYWTDVMTADPLGVVELVATKVEYAFMGII